MQRYAKDVARICIVYQYIIAIILCYPLCSIDSAHLQWLGCQQANFRSKVSMSQKSSWGYLQRTWAQPIAAHASWCSLVFSFQYFLHIARSLLLASANLESSVGQLDMCFCQSVPSKLLQIIVWLQPLQSAQWDLNTHSHFNHFITPCSNVLQWFTRAQENQKKERTSRTLVIYKMYTWIYMALESSWMIWNDTGSRRWICLKHPEASRTPHTISIHFSQSTKYSGQLSSICLSHRAMRSDV